MTDQLVNIAVTAIRPNPQQPRQAFDPAALQELADSIREHGVLQPLIVEPDINPKYFVLLAGERRWRAAQLAGLADVPCLVRQDGQGDQYRLELALVENVQREDLAPAEEARAYQQLHALGLSDEAIGQRVAKASGLAVAAAGETTHPLPCDPANYNTQETNRQLAQTKHASLRLVADPTQAWQNKDITGSGCVRLVTTDPGALAKAAGFQSPRAAQTVDSQKSYEEKRKAYAAANRIACIAQLYDEWGGHYIVQRIDGGVYVDVRKLSRDEALTYRTASGEVLRLEYGK